MAGSWLCIGLDVGGSSIEGRARMAEAEAPTPLDGSGANLQTAGPAATAERIAARIREAQKAHPEAQAVAVCAGVAGAGRLDDREALAMHLRDQLGVASPDHLEIVHDGVIALEAVFGAEAGVVVIAGTGSAVYARTAEGELERAGGWGPVLGDEGSGYALGRAGLRAVAHAFDGGPSTELSARVAEALGLDIRAALVQHVYRDDAPLQQVAPLVLDAAANGDAIARRIVDTQTGRLADQAAWLAARCSDLPRRIATLGGLTSADTYADALRTALEQRLPGWSVRIAPERPADGALHRVLRALPSSS